MNSYNENALSEQGAEQNRNDSISIFAHPCSYVKEKLAAPALPDLARSILKKAIVSMANAGLITGANAEQLISLLQLRDA